MGQLSHVHLLKQLLPFQDVHPGGCDVLHPLSQHAGDFRHEAFEPIAGAVGVVAPVQQN